ncbi:hypothetical protein Taro_021165, partial [Colocasia esculenta]|nr:hypothetical protein [Colocasia esculenta]
SHIFVLVVSTLDQSRSTLVPDSRRLSCQTGTAAERGFPDLSPSPEATSHPFKRKYKGIKGNPWREACCAMQRPTSTRYGYTNPRRMRASRCRGEYPNKN